MLINMGLIQEMTVIEKMWKLIEKEFKLINGDELRGISIIKRLLYFPQCVLNWFKGKKGYADLYVINLNVAQASEAGTPSRRLSNMFWDTIDWERLAINLGTKINMIDIGCGDGHYGNRFKAKIGKNLASYTGLDIYKNKAFPKKYNHILDSAENAHTHLDGKNVVISQSSLEHHEFDKKTLISITNSLRAKKKPFIQFHLVPASSSLWLYLWHGWRQYSERNLNLIAREINQQKDLQVQIVPLGGWRCFLVHLARITIPTLIFWISGKRVKLHTDHETTTTFTSEKIRDSILVENSSNNHLPSFWALIISHKKVNTKLIFENVN